jgi:hypothetical protein
MRATTPGSELAALVQPLGQAPVDHYADAIVEAYALDAALALTSAALGYAPRPCLPTPADDLQPARTRRRLAASGGEEANRVIILVYVNAELSQLTRPPKTTTYGS